MLFFSKGIMALLHQGGRVAWERREQGEAGLRTQERLPPSLCPVGCSGGLREPMHFTQQVTRH